MTYHNWGHASHYLTHVCTLHQSPWTPDATVYITFSILYPLRLPFFLFYCSTGWITKNPPIVSRHSNVLPRPSFLSPSRPPHDSIFLFSPIIPATMYTRHLTVPRRITRPSGAGIISDMKRTRQKNRKRKKRLFHRPSMCDCNDSSCFFGNSRE